MKIKKTIIIDNIQMIHSDLGLDFYYLNVPKDKLWTNEIGVKSLLSWDMKKPLQLGDMYVRISEDGMQFYGDHPYYLTRMDKICVKSYEKLLTWLSMEPDEWVRYERKEKLKIINRTDPQF